MCIVACILITSKELSLMDSHWGLLCPGDLPSILQKASQKGQNLLPNHSFWEQIIIFLRIASIYERSNFFPLSAAPYLCRLNPFSAETG